MSPIPIPIWCTAEWAVPPAPGSDAACSKSMFAGFGNNALAWTLAWARYAPVKPYQMISSPTENPSTPGPTASITTAVSLPGTAGNCPRQRGWKSSRREPWMQTNSP